MEAESFADSTVKTNVSGWGKKEFLTNDSWMQVNIPSEKVDTELPAGGGLLKYSFTTQVAGNYEVWNRIGFEFVRSPFEWRLDNGAWQMISPNDLTTDLMAIETWAEVAWLKMGEANLTTGSHTLEIRLPKTKGDKGNTERVLYTSDALCLTRGKFYPNGKYKPNETGRDAKDEAAQKQVFALPEYAKDGKRVTIPLAGDWEVCRNDEQKPPFNVAQPMQDFPEKPVWKAIPVPSDKNVSRPDLTFAHRLWYRTRVSVPASHQGRSFFLTFPRNNLNTTVYVNGVYCGFEKNPNVKFDMDITRGIKPGQVNEIWVGIRDAWYGYSTNPNDPMKLRRKFNIPLSFVGNGFQDLAYPIWHAWESGIVQTPTLTSAGAIYTADVFVKPRVADKTLNGDLTLNGTWSDKQTGIRFEIVDAKTNQVVKEATVSPQRFTETNRQGPFAVVFPEAKLWWPQPNPQLYYLRVTLTNNGVAEDISETRFGFREWGAKGKDFTLNGIVWHGWADLCAGDTPQEFLAQYRKSNQRFLRISGYAQGGPTWRGITPIEALHFADENGMVVRRSGDLDGEAIGYFAIEQDEDLKKLYGTEIKQQLMENWRDQMVAQVKAERNHPSIHVWSIENEWLYINCINLYAGLMDKFEAEVKQVMDAVAEVDPTRLSMVDGGGAGKDNLFPIHGDHYVFGEMTQYPALAYQANPTGGGRGRWVWDQKRPRYIGEDFFATGINPADYAVLGGEETFQGKAATRHTAGLIQNMLTQGYRWAEYGAWHFWLGSESAVNQYNSFADLAVFCQEWDSTFAPEQKVSRTLGIFNDTFDVTTPITLKWTLVADGKTVATETTTHTVPPGTSKKLIATLTLPKIRGQRAGGKWYLTLLVNGQERFRDVKSITILNPQFKISGSGIRTFVTGSRELGQPSTVPTERDVQLGGRSGNTVDRRAGVGVGISGTLGGRKPEFSGLYLYDPNGTIGTFLNAKKVGFTALNSLASLPQNARVLVIGKDALTEAESTSSRLAAWASTGRRLIVLEQKHPLKYQAFPAEMLPDTNEGRTAYIEDASHPLFTGLANSDFFTWAKGEVVYRNAYETPTRGAKSLLHCDNRLARTAIAEIPVGEGLILVNQTRTGETIETNPVAQQLLANLIAYAADYKREFRPVAAAGLNDPQLIRTLDAIGVSYQKASDPLKAIAQPGTIAIVEATPANLQTLAANKAQLDKFNKGGGWLVLLGLTPDGLEAYNKIVGFNHMIRPFRRERVTFPAQRHPLSAGLSQADIVLSSGQRINNFSNDVYLAEDAFGYVVDFDEVAPFAKLPEPSFWGYSDASNDHNPYNMVNGFNSTDGWQLIFSIWAGQGGKTYVPMTFAKPQEFTEIEWTGNAFYYPTKKIELTVKGTNSEKVASFDTVPNNEPQTFALPANMVGDSVTLRMKEWVAAREPSIVGVDNLRLKAKRSPEFYKTVKPLLNIGAMMVYEREKGGILLSNVRFLPNEAVPENRAKKQKILATLLRNLKAKFGSETTVIAGATLQYTPIDISKQANQYRDDKGWFGDKNFTFKDLPRGRQTFAGVPFEIYDFPTSPVPTAIMLGGSGVPNNLPEAVRGIPVGKKADALFFLQTARIDARKNRDEIRDRKQFEMARYIITYADGQKATIPLYAEEDLDDYRQKQPQALLGAQIAWQRPYPETQYSAVAYLKQWNNPRPDVAIRQIDLEYGKDRRGVPALLAVTAATLP
jgi:beta-galactosidase